METTKACGELMKSMKNLPDIIEASARFSECKTYRYYLIKSAVMAPTFKDTCVWIMLNPSTATEHQDDPTVRKCQKFSRRLNCPATIIVNLFGLRSTDPSGLIGHEDPVGPDNFHAVEWAVKHHNNIFVAWGSHKHPLLKTLARRVANLAGQHKRQLLCLGINKDGMPKHPLYVADKSAFLKWSMA